MSKKSVGDKAGKKQIFLKNYYLEFLSGELLKFNLDIPQSAARRRFLREIGAFIADLNEGRKEIRFKYCDKEKDGKPKLERNAMGGQEFSFSDKQKKLAATKDFKELMDLEIAIDIKESNERDIQTIKEVLSNEVKTMEDKYKGKFNAEQFDVYESYREVIGLL